MQLTPDTASRVKKGHVEHDKRVKERDGVIKRENAIPLHRKNGDIRLNRYNREHPIREREESRIRRRGTASHNIARSHRVSLAVLIRSQGFHS